MTNVSRRKSVKCRDKLAQHTPLSATDFHTLLALSRRELYGYLLLQTLDEDSGGAVQPDIGSLYRTLDRLVRGDLIAKVGERAAEIAPGKSRQYYRLTDLGRETLDIEIERLRQVLTLVDRSQGRQRQMAWKDA